MKLHEVAHYGRYYRYLFAGISFIFVISFVLGWISTSDYLVQLRYSTENGEIILFANNTDYYDCVGTPVILEGKLYMPYERRNIIKVFDGTGRYLYSIFVNDKGHNGVMCIYEYNGRLLVKCRSGAFYLIENDAVIDYFSAHSEEAGNMRKEISFNLTHVENSVDYRVSSNGSAYLSGLYGEILIYHRKWYMYMFQHTVWFPIAFFSMIAIFVLLQAKKWI